MKSPILFLLLLFFLCACKDEQVLPPKTLTITQPSAPLTVVDTVKHDTIPDKAAFRLKLGKDAVGTDETLFIFNHKARMEYFNNEDAPYLAGFGEVSLSSFSSDGQNLAINTMPYKRGMSVGLDFMTEKDGDYSLELNYQKNIPQSIRVQLNDTYLKDSVDIRAGKYHFKVEKADANSFGSKRFKLVLK